MLIFFETGLTQLLESNRVTNANIKGRGCRLYRENRKVTQDLRAKHKPFLCLLKVFFLKSLLKVIVCFFNKIDMY